MKIDVIERNNVLVNKDFLSFLDHCSLMTFDDFMGLEGTIAKSVVKERSTQRLNLSRRSIYLKKHVFVGVRQTLENLLL